jgi:hypothetical protein
MKGNFKLEKVYKNKEMTKYWVINFIIYLITPFYQLITTTTILQIYN